MKKCLLCDKYFRGKLNWKNPIEHQGERWFLWTAWV